MSSIRDIVNVQVTRETASVARTGFGVAMILATHQYFTERYREYTSLSSLKSDIPTTSPIYTAASKYFSQNPCPKKLGVGRRHASSTVITVTNARDATEYTVVINGTEFSITSGSSTTPALIAAALVSAINAGTEPVGAVAGSLGAFTLSADVATTPYSVLVNEDFTVTALTPAGTIAADLGAISDENSTWYEVIQVSRVKQDILDVAAWVEANTKIYNATSEETTIATAAASSDVTSVLAQLKASAYDRTLLMYHPSADDVFIDAAFSGKILPYTPGSYTAMFKVLAGIPVSSMTPTQVSNVLAKNGNVYTNVGGINMTQPGVMTSGEFKDVIIFVDWVIARMGENVFGLLARLPKVPLTNPGILAIAGEMDAVLQEGLNNGGISPFEFDENDVQIGGYVITPPKIQDISTADKIARNIPSIPFTFWLSGAVHTVQINGVVVV